MAAATALAIPLSATATTTPTDVAVYSADDGNQVLTDEIIFGGTTGYLHQPQGTTTYVWTTYGTGKSRVVTGLPNAFNPLSAGGDRMAYPDTSQLSAVLIEINFADNTSRTFAVGPGAVMGVSDNRLLVRTTINGAAALEDRTYADDGSFTSTVVALPNVYAAINRITQPVGDPPLQVITYRTTGSVLEDALVDLTTGAAYVISGVNPLNKAVRLSQDHVAFYSAGAMTVQVLAIADIVAGGGTVPDPIPIPPSAGNAFTNTALVGDRFVIRSAAASPFSVNDVRPDGTIDSLVPATQATTLGGSFVATADDGVVTVGGTSPADWAVRRLTEGSDGAVQNTVVQSLHGFVNAGVTISHGQVRHIDALPDLGVNRSFTMFGHDLLDPNGTSTTLPPPSGLTLPSVVTCAPGVACVVPYDNGDGVLLIMTNNQIAHVFSTVNTWLVNVPPGSSLGGGSSNDYVIINNPGTLKQYVTPTNLFLPPARALTAAAVSFDTLWSSSAAGLLTSTDLRTNVSRLVRIGGSCRPQDVQATQRWVYWSCGGNAAAGVIDLQTHNTFSVPAGRALLGDGYLVRHLSDGSLVMTDFHTDAAAEPITLANVPQGPLSDDRNVTFSVDQFGGDVAYVASDNSVHVIDPDVPRSAVVVGAELQSLGSIVTPPPATIPWSVFISLSRPVSSWTAEIRKASTGALVHSESGGLSNNWLRPSWDGLLSSGTKAVSGWYTFSLSVTPVGESTPVTLQVPADLARLVVECGQAPFRSYDCNGSAAFLGVKSDGEGHWFTALPSGGLWDNGYTENWPLGTASWQFSTLVPFGDFNGDGFNDLIARDGAGTLWAYDGFGQAYFGANTKQKIGSGWNVYNTVFSPGDLNGDGFADLVGRDTSGNLYLYRGSGKSAFAAKVKIGSGWSALTIVGAGDLTGDGLGDVVGIDSSGRLWLWAGRVNGLAAKVQIGTGWSVFNAVIGAGDVNGDGHNDLVARKSNGVLMLYRGNGTGQFGAGVQIGTGFQAYSRLF